MTIQTSSTSSPKQSKIDKLSKLNMEIRAVIFPLGAIGLEQQFLSGDVERVFAM